MNIQTTGPRALAADESRYEPAELERRLDALWEKCRRWWLVARALQTTEQTLGRWRRGESAPNRHSRLRLEVVERCVIEHNRDLYTLGERGTSELESWLDERET